MACEPWQLELLEARCCRSQAAELEDFLFGSKSSAAEVFSKRKASDESDDDDLTLADLLVRGGSRPPFHVRGVQGWDVVGLCLHGTQGPSSGKQQQQLFFEDRAGDVPEFALGSSDDEEGDEEGGSEDASEQQDEEDEAEEGDQQQEAGEGERPSDEEEDGGDDADAGRAGAQASPRTQAHAAHCS